MKNRLKDVLYMNWLTLLDIKTSYPLYIVMIVNLVLPQVVNYFKDGGLSRNVMIISYILVTFVNLTLIYLYTCLIEVIINSSRCMESPVTMLSEDEDENIIYKQVDRLDFIKTLDRK